jgi:diguanylate cyclase (GGDEF)-like protein
MQSMPATPADDALIQAALMDPARLVAVHGTGLLDTLPEQGFDRLTRLTAKWTGAPATFLSVLDAHRDFLKSTFGVDEPLHSARQLHGRSLCHHALVSGHALVLGDVLHLPVFRDVPMVASWGVRAYAGIPLKTAEGKVLGTFCAVDFKPRAWSAQDIEILGELAHSALREIRLRKALQEADVVNQQLRAQTQRADALKQALSDLATTDPLTGLNNRRAFDTTLQMELAIVERRNTPLSLLMLDVDHFSRINTLHGHMAADKMLIGIAQLLDGCARVTDLVARTGSEAFAVILPYTDAGGALEAAERMRAAVAQATWLAHPTTMSIGVATLLANEPADRLCARANAALCGAKANGQNRVVVG